MTPPIQKRDLTHGTPRRASLTRPAGKNAPNATAKPLQTPPGRPVTTTKPPKPAARGVRAQVSGLRLDQAGALFLPYQRRWIEDRLIIKSRLRGCEKANRIGWTWCDAFASVASRIEPGAADYLFMSQNYAGALEYLQYVREFLKLFDLARFAAIGEETLPGAKGFADEIKVGMVKFESGARILCFSSNPWALQTFEGEPAWDEADFHERQEDVYTAVQSRMTWGHSAGMWSALNNRRTFFKDVLMKQAKAPGSVWSYHRVDIYKAIEEGLVERINAKANQRWTREEFLADCKRRAITPAIFSARYELNAVDDGSAIVEWRVIESCRDDAPILRAHFDDDAVSSRFGVLTPGNAEARRAAIHAEMHRRFGALAERAAHHRLGFDVAASGNGHLGSFWVDVKDGSALRLRALLTTQTQDWHFLECALAWFLKNVPAIRGAGDETGLGKQVCWNAAKMFPNQFRPVNFSSQKAALGTLLMHQLSERTKRLPRGEDDVAMDLYGIQKETTAKGAVMFTEASNPLNALSHCDIAWSAALASWADAHGSATPVTMTNLF